ncbi:DUF3575 domain-containing protein [Pinibacter aurantiacus]|uniref:DUF3575 domain-containing protein n=1 Tax=Pinibacter aurantiacus TaxID=2851599 RepID=A0A9E2W6F9_9BACT|nr:DUF3575 domain-containing protein [Pinibacter aurantiacus]MBV4359793.1 DUF3575 domain-containing protein [Pinibacter aurantiacus]
MKNKTNCVLLTLVIAAHLSAQSKYDQKGDLSVRWNFPGMVDPLSSNLTMGAEYRFLPHWSFVADAGWIFASPSEGGKVSGYLIRPAVRYYPSLRHFFFFEAQFHYKYIQKKEQAWVPHEVQNDIPIYEKYEDVKLNARSYSLNLLCGTQSTLRKPGGAKWDRLNRLKFEYYWGLGFHYYEEAKPTRSAATNDFITFPSESTFVLTPQLGITLVYRVVDKSMAKKILP